MLAGGRIAIPPAPTLPLLRFSRTLSRGPGADPLSLLLLLFLGFHFDELALLRPALVPGRHPPSTLLFGHFFPFSQFILQDFAGRPEIEPIYGVNLPGKLAGELRTWPAARNQDCSLRSPGLIKTAACSLRGSTPFVSAASLRIRSGSTRSRRAGNARGSHAANPDRCGSAATRP